MKRILITGLNSYVGNSFASYLARWPQDYQIEKISLRDNSWWKTDFSHFDAIYHVAGIAHSDIGKLTVDKKAQYYKINTDLTVNVAKKASQEGVRQFVFMSSAIVYGDSAPIGVKKIITRDTVPSPSNFYSDSKVQAEIGLRNLQNNNFNIAVLRPPMIYGKGSKGNYPVLAKLAQRIPVFPYIENERSMIYVENLMEFVKHIVDENIHGVFWPQNAEYSNTSEIVKIIAESHGKKICFIKNLDWALKAMSSFSKLANKAFGNFVYEKGMSEYYFSYQYIGLVESIRRTEGLQ